MTNFEEIKRKIANMNIDELMEFCGGDTCENVLCAFVRDGDAETIAGLVMIAEAALKSSCKERREIKLLTVQDVGTM